MEPINPLQQNTSTGTPPVEGATPTTVSPVNPAPVGNDVRPAAAPGTVVSATTESPEAPEQSSSMATQDAQVAPSVSSTPTSSVEVSPKQTGKKKGLLLALVAGGVAALLVGGYVFGMYLPNRPEAVFKRSLVASGMAADKLVTIAEKNTSLKTSVMDGTLAVKSSGTTIDAKITGKSDAKNFQYNLATELGGQKFSADFMLLSAEKATNPDIYLKVNGIKSFATQPAMAPLASLDGQWIVADHTFLNNLQKQSGTPTNSLSLANQPTTAQISDAMQKIQSVNKQYLFNSDPAKAVVTYKTFVGTETRNSRSVNHYTAGYNKENLKNYLRAVGEALDTSSLNGWIKQSSGKNMSETLSLDSLVARVDKTKGDETFDMYVDRKTKVVQGLTFTDKAGKQGTLSLNQNYTGGDEYPFEVHFKGTDKNKTDVKIGLSVNAKSNVVKAVVTAKTSDTMELTMNIKGTPSNEKLSLTAPTGAKPITEVAKLFGADTSSLLGGQAAPTGTPANGQAR